MQNNADKQSDGITWVSAQSLIQLRMQANQLPLDSKRIHAKQGGAYLSSFKGRGMEFDESRIYQAGDDIRNMDWKVTARSNTPYTKVFREERERPILLWLDLNPSMMFATRNKFKAVIAAEVASLIAWSAAKNNDRVGGLIFSANQHTELRPRRGKKAALDFIGRCCKHSAWSDETNSTGSTTEDKNHLGAISRLRKVTHPGSLIFMISDFRDMDEKAFSHIANLSRNNDIIFIKITDPIESDLPVAGSYKLTDGDNELQLQTTDKKSRSHYHQKYLKSHQQIEKFCRQYRIHLIPISTADDTFGALKAGLGIRGNSAQYRALKR